MNSSSAVVFCSGTVTVVTELKQLTKLYLCLIYTYTVLMSIFLGTLVTVFFVLIRIR